MPDEIRCTLRLTSSDLALAQKAMERGGYLRKLIVFIVISTVILLGLFGYGFWRLFNIFQYGIFVKEPWLALWNEPIALCMLVTCIVAPIFSIFICHARKKARKLFDETSHVIKCAIDKDRITFEEEKGTLSLPWSDFVEWHETPELFLFYETDTRTRFLPKRFLSQPELDQLREWLKTCKPESQKKQFELDLPDLPNAIRCSGGIRFEEYASTRSDFYIVQLCLISGLEILLILLVGMGIVGRLFPDEIQALNNGHPVDFNAPFMTTSRFIILFVFFALYHFLLVFLRKIEKENFKKDQHIWGESSYILTSEFIASAGSHGKSLFYWKDFTKWSENNLVFLLYQKIGPALIFPKRLLDKEKQIQLRGWLRDSI